MNTAEELRKMFGLAAPTGAGPLTPVADGLRDTFKIPKATSTSTPFTDAIRAQFPSRLPEDTPFVKQVKEMTTKTVRELAAAGDKAAIDSGKLLGQWFTNKLQVSPADWYQGVAETANGTATLTGKLAQGFNEGVFRIGKSAYKAAGGRVQEPEAVGKDLDQSAAQELSQRLEEEGRSPRIQLRQTGEDSYTYDVIAAPKQGTVGRILSTLEGDLTGRKGGVSTYQTVYGDVEKWATEQKATPIEAKNFAGFAVLGLLFADNPITGPGKAGLTLSKEGIEALAKAETDDAVIEVLKRENPNIPGDVLEFVTPSMRAADTPAEVTTVLRITNKAARQAATTAGSEVESAAKLKEPKVRIQGKTSDIPDELVELAVEARKYESPEEFMAGQTATRFSRFISDAELAEFKKTGQLPPARDGFVDLIEPGKLSEVRPSAAAPHLVTFTDEIEPLVREARIAAGDLAAPARLSEPVAAPLIETIIENPRELYTQATKAPELPKQALEKPPADTGYAPTVNLVRNIAKTSDEYEMLKILEREFPNLPEPARDKLVNKLVRLRRTSDIEGYLKAGERMNRSPVKLNPKQKKVLDDTLPKSVGELMDDSEKIRYVQNLSRTIDGDETAVMALNEYERILEHADAGIVDKYNELQFQKSILEEVVSEDNAGELWTRYYRYYKNRNPDDPTTSLHDIMDSVHKKTKENRDYAAGGGSRKKPHKLTPNEELAYSLDSEIEYLGYKDFDEAQEAVERYARMRTQVKEMEQELRDLRPYFQGAVMLRGLLDEIPVIETKGASVIDELANTADIRSTYQDIAGLNAGFRDVYRNFRRFFGPRYDEIKKAVLDPFDRSKGQYVDEIAKQGDELEANVIEKYGIARGSKDSGRIQLFGEGLLKEEDLIEQVGVKRAKEIQEAAGWFREKYNGVIDEINDVRRQMYPNNPEKLIAYRKDYFHHFTELGDDFRSAVANFFDTPSGIKPELVGISETTQPKSKFLSFAEQRKGKETEVDAVGGFIDYVPMFAYAKHVDPHISVFRYVRRKLAEKAPTRGAEVPLLDELTGQELPGGGTFKHKGIDNFLGFLDDFANDLAGKTNPMERFIQKRIPGGRATMRIIDWMNNRAKATAILGNLGVIVAQVASFPLTISRTRQYAAPGMARTLAGIINREGPITESIFLKERHMEALKDRFPVQFTDKPLTATIDGGRKVLAWMLRVSDQIAGDFAWNSNYAKALSEGIDDPVKFADEQTREILGGRGIGEVPIDQKAKLFQLVAPFQLEVGNFWNALDDRARNYYKGAGNREWEAIVTVLFANYAFNEAAEQIRGSRVVYDPVNALIEGSIDLMEEVERGDPGTGVTKLLGRQAGEFLSNIPLGQTIASTLVPDDVRQGLFGSQNPTRFGEVPLLAQTGQRAVEGAYNLATGTGDPAAAFTQTMKNLLSIVLPYGTRQIEKSAHGIEAMVTGTADNAAGDLSYVVKPTVENWVRAVLFGQAATTEARKYFEERDDLFQNVDRQDKTRKQKQLEAESDWAELKRVRAKDGEAAANELYTKMATENKDLAKDIATIKKDEDAGLDGNDRLIKMLGVDNGERAKYIFDKMNKLKTSEEKNAYYKYLAERDLISKQVFAQLQYLIQQSTQ